MLLVHSLTLNSRFETVPFSFSASANAWAKETNTERSAFPIRNLPSKLRTMYLASTSWQAARSLVIMETFLACDWYECQKWITSNILRTPRTEWPVQSAISRNFWNTNGTVSGLGLKSVFWLFFEFCCIIRSRNHTMNEANRGHPLLQRGLDLLLSSSQP